MRYTLDPNSPYHQMELKMMRVAVRAEKKFLKNCGDEYSEHIKAIKSTPITMSTSERLIANYAYACRSELTDEHFQLSITLSHSMQNYNRKLVYEIISHELAHCIDFIVRGESYHDEEWRKIHQLMDGTGNTGIEYRSFRKSS